ncbi:hypothetical protein Q3G72_022290 [Acer saccharum]|nr:hypothetical protein Q3G72_022290 [Acer saccharum]
MKNWSSWCLSALCEGIDKYVKNRQRLKTCCISGCVLFLQLFYLYSLQWNPPMVDKALTPVVCWTNIKIKKCVARLQTEGGVRSNQISVEDSFKQPSPLEGQYDAAAHGETSHGNQEPGTGNNAHMKGVHDVLQVVKEIQDTLKSELHDIRTKVNFLYAKFSSMEEKNFNEDLHNTTSHQKSKNDRPPNPTLNSPPPPPSPSRHLSIPTIQHPVVEDTLKDDILEHESQSSNKRRVIQTRSTSKRKPSRYQISPYIAVPVNVSTKYRYGPFQIGIQLNTYDEHLITYIFDKNLPSSEVIVDLGHLQYSVFTCADGEQYSLKKSLSKLRESYMSDLRRCQQIYIPINDLRNHWYLAVFDLNKRDCQIWDSNPPRKKGDLTRLNQVRKLMESLDIVLADDISVAFPTTFSFTSFSISYQKAPHQPNGYDCGLLLCMFMDDNCPTTLQMKSKKAEDHYNKLLSTGEVVPNVKRRPAPMKKLRGKAAALLE